MEDSKVTVSFKLSNRLSGLLDKEAKKKEVNRSVLIRQILLNHYEHDGRSEPVR